MRSADDKAALAREVLAAVAAPPHGEEARVHGAAYRRLDQQP
jgi:hypothetical protein